MSERKAGLQEVLGAHFWSQMNNIYTAIPCVVIAVRNSGVGAVVDIQPTLNQRFVDGRVSQRVPILGVPVSFPVSSNAGVLFPVEVGTTGLAIFSMRSLDTWKASRGGNVTPPNRAKFDKSDAVFFPGIQPTPVNISRPQAHTFPHSTKDTVIFNNIGKSNEVEVRLKADGGVVINSNTNVSVNAPSISMNCDTFSLTASSANFNIGSTSWSGNFDGSGTYTFGGITYNTHKHSPSGDPPQN